MASGRGGHDDEQYGEDIVTIGISKSIASEQGFTLLAAVNELWNVGFNYLSAWVNRAKVWVIAAKSLPYESGGVRT